ncbi:Predicted flavoprotein CzcO associated with the cation diffusion facilitator CzcD [Lentzea fradiae]|uniref:Flavin-containing monooxygenase 5 n=1 Tax=Lentzea fradiae TaxID=200378 RepID=A0A1G7ZY08_9PSEU|nr:NAD(P)-binding domain-containing protein [Lentzea fradiae]SDH13496.1 Predicted flavoprotein CzcO associated with the cation diffusion facilitator CzcD [Lentzea fradiae]
MERVCVIGAGSSGIAACQVLSARGIEYDCLELGSEVGGNWRYQNDNGMSSAYRSLHINTSRQMMEFKSYPMPSHLPVYPSHFQIAEYFDDFVKHFGFRDRIRFRTEVVSVTAAPGGYTVTSRDRDSGEETSRVYRSVIVANGHHWSPRMPEPAFPGSFDGEEIHAHHYKTPEPFADKRVLVLGIGNSACDIAVETSRVSKRTFLAMRRGAHIMPKYLFGMPTDHLTTSPLARFAPKWLQTLSMSMMLRLSRGKLSDYGLPEPSHGVFSAHPTVSDDLLTRLGHGDITVKPNVRELDGSGVVFEDGSREDIDVIFYCTGYKFDFPFLDGAEFPAVSSEDNEVSLYRRVVDPDHPGLYFVGLIQPLGAIMPLAEAQAEWIADLESGRAALPPVPEMKAEITSYREGLRRRYIASKRHTVEVDFLHYQRELKAERKAGAARV